MNATLILRLLVAATLGITVLHAKGPDPVAAAATIDGILVKDWAKHKLTGNPMSDDPTFVRRIYLDIVGRIPTTRETEEFLQDKSDGRRAKLIDRLLASEGYVHHAFNFWADVLRMNQNGVTGAAYVNFIKTSLRDNKPYNKLVEELIAAQGRAWENGAIGYYLRDQNMPLDNMANTVRVFLGTRLECAQCHNHPFDKWSQMQFYQMAAYTFGIQGRQYPGTVSEVEKLIGQKQAAERNTLKEPPRPKRDKDMSSEQFDSLQKDYQARMNVFKVEQEQLQKKLRNEQRNYQEAMQEVRRNVSDGGLGYDGARKVNLPRDYKYPDANPRSPVAPKSMFGHECQAEPGETNLQAYARWMTSRDNPRFTTVITNRLWRRAFGLALIEPLDELMDTSEPMIPELQSHLDQLMRDLGYDMKSFQRVLYNTKAYQRQVTREEIPSGVVYHFTGPVLRRMTAEQMWDSFITLINPNPDMPNQAARESMEQQVLQARKSVDAMNSMNPEDVFKTVTKAADLFSGQAAGLSKLQKTITEATTRRQELEKQAKELSGEEAEKAHQAAVAVREEINKLRRSVNDLTRDARLLVQTDVSVAAQKKLYEKVTGKPYQTAMLQTGSGSETRRENNNNSGNMMMAANNPNERVLVPGYDPAVLTPEERTAATEKRHQTFEVEAKYFGIPETELRNYYNSRENQSRTWLRAAEIQSPAPRGHYLREFGQSDREFIENANREASVSQALAMMNGQLLPEILNRFSQLMLTVNKAPYPEDKVDAIFMTLFSRKPTAAERGAWQQAQGKDLTAFEDLIWSLLNTQQFIFVQ